MTYAEIQHRHGVIMSMAKRYIIYKHHPETWEPMALMTTDDRLEAFGMLGLYGGEGIYDCETQEDISKEVADGAE